jgi:predicted FMN-binding regulatory protein PaiB
MHEIRDEELTQKMINALDFEQEQQTSIPTLIELNPAKIHEVNILDIITPEAGAFIFKKTI